MIVSLGTAYSGLERFLFAVDVRFIDYANTKGFDRPLVDATGAFTTLGWDSVVAVAAGAQFQLSERIALRAGYSFNENPISDSVSFANIASPAIYEHILWLGGSFQVSDALSLTAAYYHAFENSIAGPLVGSTGPVPGFSITNSASIDSITVGISVKF